MAELEDALVASHTPETAHKLSIKQKEYRDIAEDAARTQHRATQHRIYDIGYKASKLLAWLDKRESANMWVTQIIDQRGLCNTG